MPLLSAYTLAELLHAGPLTVLHRGYRNADRAPVVIKLLKSEYPSPREVARLRHEYLICRALDAPGIVKACALEKAGHGLALILEDFGGRPLVELVRSRRLDLKTVLQIALSLAEAIGAIHDRHIIHKDIKPHNILVNPSTGVVKLTDFGIATRLFQETHKETPPDALEGTLAYMSPEQTGRMNRALDYRTDFYSLGVTLYEMLTGALPFVATEPMELVHSHIARTPPSPPPDVPAPVAAIVMKLLAKAAEDRYQSAYGLKADLDTCLSQWSATGAIAPFPLGQKDLPSALRIGQKLYGREAETAALLAAFARASAGGAELLLVSGYAGVGKSALVSEIHQAIGRRAGYFCAGKFYQLSRNVPYTAVAAALQELVRHLLAEPEEALARWKRDLLAALGNNGQLLVDLIPELAWVVGPQPAVPELGPTESQNRFSVVFQSFLRVFTTAAHPLVLFLDDLQWADPGSLKLLSLLLLDPDRGHLLVLGAYRDHEVGPGHLLSLALEELRRDGAQVGELALLPLGLSDVETLIADSLGADRAKVSPLARLAFDKTHGNPFFLGQLLKALHAEGWITLDRGAGVWVWDLERIRTAQVTDNVVEFMSGKIARLQAETQRALLFAACIGHQFDLKTLSVISEMPPRTAATALWEALQEGLVVPLDAEYRFVGETEDPNAEDAAPSQTFDVAYRFLHDRVQQAAYALIEERHKQEVHLRIGRLLRDQRDAQEREGRLFAIVDHLNLGATLIGDRTERLDLARSNLAAGKRAKAAAAYQAALGYLDAAAALVDEASWREEYPLAFALHLERAECVYLNGQFAQAEALFGVLLAHAESRLDRAQVYKLCILLATSRNDFAGALRFGRTALAMFGIDLPETEERQKAAFDAELAALEANLASRRIEELIDAPLLADPDHRATLEIMVQLGPATFFSGFILSSLFSTRLTNLCLRHGRSEFAAFICASATQFQIRMLGDHKVGREFFRVSCALDEQFAAIALRGRTYVVLISAVHFFISFRSMLPYVARAQRATLEAGDFLYLPFTCYHDVMLRLCAGEELSSVADVLPRSFALARRTKSELVIATLVITRQLVAALEGRTRSRASLSDDEYDEAAHLAALAGDTGLGFALCWLHTVKLELLCLQGDYPAALAAAAQAKATVGGASVMHFYTDVPFYAGLSLAGLYPSASPEDQARYASLLSEHQARIATWAESCPENYRHKQLLLAAEAARIAGKHHEAEDLYDAAIEAARDNDVTHHEALANELAARHCLGQGKKKFARLYLNEAYHGYLRWGATAKASDLAERYPDLLGAAFAAAKRSLDFSGDTTIGEDMGSLDTAALVQAAQALAAELVLEKLLDRLLRIIVENAGADRGVLLLCRDEQWVIEATMTVEPELVRVGLGAPLDADAELALSVVHFVQRTMELVVLGDATRGGQFAGDPYLLARPPKSLLCFSMAHQGRVAGILYLENHAVLDAFTPARVELASLLLSHAAIAVENALLVAELRRRAEVISETNAALGEANEALRSANARLERELYEREQAERARAALQGELFRVQTPFIPITDQMAVMPLIGTIDAARAPQVLETALRGVASSRARVVILDVTGVEWIDADVTSTLVSTTRALRLLGVLAVITGVRPETARSLVELGLDLSGVVTQGTLQGGIAYAMERLGRASLRALRRSAPSRE